MAVPCGEFYIFGVTGWVGKFFLFQTGGGAERLSPLRRIYPLRLLRTHPAQAAASISSQAVR